MKFSSTNDDWTRSLSFFKTGAERGMSIFYTLFLFKSQYLAFHTFSSSFHTFSSSKTKVGSTIFLVTKCPPPPKHVKTSVLNKS